MLYKSTYATVMQHSSSFSPRLLICNFLLGQNFIFAYEKIVRRMSDSRRRPTPTESEANSMDTLRCTGSLVSIQAGLGAVRVRRRRCAERREACYTLFLDGIMILTRTMHATECFWFSTALLIVSDAQYSFIDYVLLFCCRCL